MFGREENADKVFSRTLKEIHHLEKLGIDGRATLQRILKNIYTGRVWIGFIWLRIGTNGRLLCTR
jgi:hypothetical protein